MNTRQEHILEILKQKKAIAIADLSNLLAYSHSTIRRDLITLEEMGLVQREKGFVRLLMTNSKEKNILNSAIRSIYHKNLLSVI